MNLRQLTCDKCGALFLVEDHKETVLWRRFCDLCWQPERDEPTTVQVKIKTEYRWAAGQRTPALKLHSPSPANPLPAVSIDA